MLTREKFTCVWCVVKSRRKVEHTMLRTVWLLSRMSTHLAELIFPSTSVIVPTPSLQIHPKTLDTRAPPLRLPYSPKHCVFHLSSAFQIYEQARWAYIDKACKRSLRDLMNEFSQSVPPICKRSIQRRLSNLWLSQENCCEKNWRFGWK
jgi:hypothetical protein